MHFLARSLTDAGRGHVAEDDGTQSVPTSSGQPPASASASVVLQLMLSSCIWTATHQRSASVASRNTTCTTGGAARSSQLTPHARWLPEAQTQKHELGGAATAYTAWQHPTSSWIIPDRFESSRAQSHPDIVIGVSRPMTKLKRTDQARHAGQSGEAW